MMKPGIEAEQGAASTGRSCAGHDRVAADFMTYDRLAVGCAACDDLT